MMGMMKKKMVMLKMMMKMVILIDNVYWSPIFYMSYHTEYSQQMFDVGILIISI